MSDQRSWLVLTDGWLTARNAKTAHGVIKYGRGRIAAVVDREHAGQSLIDVLPQLGRDAPIVPDVEQGLAYEPTSLLLGVATPGGWIPDHWRAWVVTAIENGLEIANGLHVFLNEDPELVRLARHHGAQLWDVRDPPADIALFSGRTLALPKRVVLTVGSDCAVGKMTATLELASAGHAEGYSTQFVPTGQTGILIAGWGIAVDRVISDFVAGASERLACETHPSTDVVMVEGQGSLWHPAYSAVTLGLLHGACPDVMVLCHKAGRDAIEEPPYTKYPPLAEMVDTYEQMASTLRPSKVACIAVNCGDGVDRERELRSIEDETGLVAGDVFAGDAPRLWKAVASELPPRRGNHHT